MLLAAAFAYWAFSAAYLGMALLVAALSCALFGLIPPQLCPALEALRAQSAPAPAEEGGKRSLRFWRRHPWLKIALGLLALRLLLYAFAYAADIRVNGYTGSLLNTLERLWTRTDAPHYIGIAKNWYVAEGDPRFHIVFFPLYPLVIRLIGYLCGGSGFAAALVASNLCAIGGGILLYELAALDYPRRDALYTLLIGVLLPGALFLGAPMSESLFLLLSLACMLCARKRKFLLAGAFGALAAFTRSLGVLLAVPIAVEFLLCAPPLKSWHKKDIARLLVSLAIVGLGTAGYVYINYAVTGDAFKFLQYQREHWHQALGFFWNTAAYQTEYLLSALAQGDMRMAWGLYLPNLLAAFGALAIMLPAARRLRPSYSAYFLVYFAVSIGCTWLLSGPRYLAVCFPLPLTAAALLRHSPKWLRVLAPVGLGCLLLVYTALYVLGYPVY